MKRSCRCRAERWRRDRDRADALSTNVFTFEARWKEELVVTGPGGTFILELPMGILSAYLPTEQAWRDKAPTWAVDLWPELKIELEQWCQENKARFYIDETATVSPV
jgi:hypothetical protein